MAKNPPKSKPAATHDASNATNAADPITPPDASASRPNLFAVDGSVDSAKLPPLSRYQGFETITIDRRKIKNAEYNPRQITPAQRRKLTQSLKRFKLVEPLIWNQRTGNLVGGHQRLSILDDLHGTAEYSLTVAKINVDDATEKAINIALNNPENQGQYDYEMLAGLIGDSRDTSPALIQDAGFDSANLAMLFGDDFLTGDAARQAADDAPLAETLDEMYQAGADAERAHKATKRPAGGGQSGDDDNAAATDDADANAGDSADPDAPPDGSDPDANAEGDGEQTYGQKGWTKQDFKDRRREFKGNKTMVDEANVFLTTVFDNSAQLGLFLEQYGFDPNLTTIDASLLIGAIGQSIEHLILFPVANADGTARFPSEDD